MNFNIFWMTSFIVTFVTGTYLKQVSNSSSTSSKSTRIEQKELLFKRCHNVADLRNANLSLLCNGKDVLAIHLAYFSTAFPEDCSLSNIVEQSISFENDSNSLNSLQSSYVGCIEDLRLTLNALCSGLNNCTFDYNTAATYFEKCDSFAKGWINIQYTCVSEKHKSSFCQQQHSASFGYLSTPGYPSYYSPFACRWSINAELGQKIQLEIIDMSVREPNILPLAVNRRRKPNEPSEKCLDALNIIDQDAKARTFCGERNSNLIEYRSLGESLSIEFIPIDFSPLRGIFMKYSLVNCPTLHAPSNGYMQRNGSFAYYSCNFDQVFEDTGLQDLILYCVDDHYWNGSVARCVAPGEHEDLLDSQRAKLASSILSNLTFGLEAIDKSFVDSKNQKAYGQFSRSLWVIIFLIVLFVISLFVLYQCLIVNAKHCFNRAGNYRIDERPISV